MSFGEPIGKFIGKLFKDVYSETIIKFLDDRFADLWKKGRNVYSMEMGTEVLNKFIRELDSLRMEYKYDYTTKIVFWRNIKITKGKNPFELKLFWKNECEELGEQIISFEKEKDLWGFKRGFNKRLAEEWGLSY